jgi:Insect cuticle protein.
VRGSYSFRVEGDGVARRVDNSVGSATAFVTKGSHPPISSKTSGRARSLEYSSPGQSRPTSYDQKISSSKGSRPSSYSFSSGIGRPQGVVGSDGSYSFAYNAGDSSRQESADVQNNVRGSFTFKSKDDGKTRRVDYEAGADTGFIAKGSHLPSVFNPLSSTSNGGYSGVLSSKSPVRDDSSTFSDSKREEASSGDASYSFSYTAGDKSRQESSDAQGNINGQYPFIGTDGVQRKVVYSAGAGRGLLAKAGPSGSPASFGSFSQTPVTSYSSEAGISSTGIQSDGSYSFSYNAGDHSRQESGDAQNNVRGTYSFRTKDDGQTRRINYEAGAATGFIAKGTDLPAPVPPYGTGNDFSSFPSQPSVRLNPAGVDSLASSSGSHSDGSYSFFYNTADQSRQESGDAQNNVLGSFTFKAKDDRNTRRVDYKAGANTGFIAKQAHIPEGSTAPFSVSDATGTVLSHTKHFAFRPHVGPVISEAPKPSDDSYSSYNAGDHSREESSDSQGNNVSHDNRSSGDGTYSYSYQTDSSSKQETSDAQGNVVGTFSFLGGDGVVRNVHYTSRGNEGFVVSGEHIPKDVKGDTIRASAGSGAVNLAPGTVTPSHIK